jgi:hypothetical protein
VSLPAPERDGIYLCIPDGPPGRSHYGASCLAQGLHALGVPVFSNVPLPPAALGAIERPGPHVYVFTVSQRAYGGELLKAIEAFPAAHKVFLSTADITGNMITPPRIPALMAHENRFRRMQGRRFPWAFGLSNEILAASSAPLPFDQRQEVVIRNFRPSGNQAVRNVLDLALVGHLARHLAIDRTVDADHLPRLGRSLGCLAYGGYFDESPLLNEDLARDPAVKNFYELVTYVHPTVILRWDSWRFWESLASGCLTFHLDFEKYGFDLPVLPRAWEHYVPIDLADPVGTVEALMAQRSRWAEIAAHGRDWARTQYSPEAVARRLLEHLASEAFWPA